MRKGFLIYEEMRKYCTIYEEAVSNIWLCNCYILNFHIYEENLIFFFFSVFDPKPCETSCLTPRVPEVEQGGGSSQFRKTSCFFRNCVKNQTMSLLYNISWFCTWCSKPRCSFSLDQTITSGSSKTNINFWGNVQKKGYRKESGHFSDVCFPWARDDRQPGATRWWGWAHHSRCREGSPAHRKIHNTYMNVSLLRFQKMCCTISGLFSDLCCFGEFFACKCWFSVAIISPYTESTCKSLQRTLSQRRNVSEGSSALMSQCRRISH